MVKIAGSKKLKRQMAPLFWGITRKDKRFVVTVKPGSHGRSISIPSSVFLRDTLKIVKTLREAKSVIYDGKVLVDGIKRKSLHHGIGLMDRRLKTEKDAIALATSGIIKNYKVQLTDIETLETKYDDDAGDWYAALGWNEKRAIVKMDSVQATITEIKEI